MSTASFDQPKQTVTAPPVDYEIEYPFEDTANSVEENKIRGNWSSRTECLLSCVGFLFNYRHLWALPHLASTYGGALFFIPYLMMLLFIAVPFLLLEYSLGQFSSLGCISVWKVCPLFQGIGISMFVISALVSIYYNVVVAWAIHYLIASLRTQVAWANCDNTWNTDACLAWDPVKPTCLSNGTGSCISTSNVSEEKLANFSLDFVWPSEEYFSLEVLEMSSGVTDFGLMLWQLALYFLAGWLLQFFCLFNHVRSAGKVAYISTIVPQIILLVFFVKCLTVNGGYEGVRSFFLVDWKRLRDYRVWGDAALQAFFSLTCSWGTFITLSSYNRFHSDCFKDVIFLCVSDFIFSLFVCLVTYSVCGFLASETGVAFENLLVKGPRLVFVIFAEAIARFPIAPVWAVMYFIMIIMIFVVANVVTSLCDHFARRLRKNQRHVLSLALVIFYVAGLIFCTKAGIYYFEFCENYVIGCSVLTIAFFECMAISWVYGVDNALDNLKWMTGYYLPLYILWKIHLKFLSPLILLALILYACVQYQPLTYEQYAYPDWMNALGWALSILPLVIIIMTGLFNFLIRSGVCVKRFRDLMIPEDAWGPALAVHRAEEFPLQIPEAREPISCEMEPLFPHHVDRTEDMETLNGSYIKRLDRVDRETAI
ncbi:sodium dependent acetylcholine transporter [Trichuris trichiura]|uniref:Sodium dependent acetylcholine transporter n=1 Tax=Trichuris trichiura TaxID=36087 RepID=A0A077Z9Q0_TRITR|nr:sodium dependent acetylcholine transporter [Trichuris trichiura]